jgi:osmotically-inducible protein OsmY
MRTFINGLVLGLLVGGLLGWFGHAKWNQPSPANEIARLEADRASQAAGAALFHAGEALRAKAQALNLQPERIRDELARTGQVVRRQAIEIGTVAADAAAETAVTAKIKAALAADSELSVFDIAVATNASEVTLEGTVESEEQVARAVVIAMETEGVERVVSKLKPKPR